MSKILNYGSYVKLTADAGPIPAGTYKYIGEENGIDNFKVSSEIMFGLPAEYRDSLKKIPASQGLKTRTTSAEFLFNYIELLKKDNLKISGGATFCGMSPYYSNIVMRELGSGIATQIH